MSERRITWLEVIASGVVFGVVVTILGTILVIVSMVMFGVDSQAPTSVLVSTFLQFVLLWVLFGASYSYFSKKRLY